MNFRLKFLLGLKDHVGHILSITALLFAVKLTALGALYDEGQNLLEMGQVSALCLEVIDTSRLESLAETVLPLVNLIDIAFYALLFVPFTIIAGVTVKSIEFRDLKASDCETLISALPMLLIFLVMAAFAHVNVGVTGYMQGSTQASMEGAPKLQAWWDEEDRSALCRGAVDRP